MTLSRQPLLDLWENSWKKADFSWSGLASKTSPNGRIDTNFQGYLRHLSGDLTDQQLIDAGVLINIDGEGLYHICFIPKHWLARLKIEINAFSKARTDIACKIAEGAGQNWEPCGISIYYEEFHLWKNRPKYNNCMIVGDVCWDETMHHLRLAKCYVFGSIRSSGYRSIHLQITNSTIDKSINIETESTINATFVCKFSNVREKLHFRNYEINLEEISHSDFGSIVIQNCEIRSNLSLIDCSIKLVFLAHRCLMSKEVNLTRVEICNSLIFNNCDIIGRSSFEDVRFLSSKYRKFHTTGSRFKELVSFTLRDPPPVQLFYGGTFEGNVFLDAAYSRKLRSAFDGELNQEVGNPIVKRGLASRIEVACRNLRRMADQRGDAQMEHFWHRAELASLKVSGRLTADEMFFSHLYGLASDYGTSITKPFLWLLVCTTMFAILYAYIGGDSWYGSPDWTSIGQGIGFSLNQMFPLGKFAVEDKSWVNELLGCQIRFSNIPIRLAATIQTIISICLIYLGVMAIRRKFKLA